MSKKIAAPYPLGGIKYFRPDGAILAFNCPHCSEAITIDAGEGFIEYPEAEQVIDWVECDCGESISLLVKISITVEIEYRVQEAPDVL